MTFLWPMFWAPWLAVYQMVVYGLPRKGCGPVRYSESHLAEAWLVTRAST